VNKVLKRINVDAVGDMFTKAGIKPAIGVNAYCIWAGYTGSKYWVRNDLIDQGFSSSYITGVMAGWDNDKLKDYTLFHDNLGAISFLPVDIESLEFKIGYADGAAARKKVFPE
jgi:hypothetical protein